MIIVLGSVIARPDCLPALLDAAREHVRRSRGEPGCLAHAVHVDHENPLRLVFVEKWTDENALAAHFRLPASIGFVKTARALATGEPVIEVFAATPLSRR
ncbi:MAG: putative quinol monooxygenase [Alphaproteobacteria bacterium]|jgi:quinol monooxygenase YgiN